jgi:hypothetical protein
MVAMVTKNGARSISELLAEIERYDREAEIERRVEERLAEERARERAEEQRRAEAQMRGVKRSQLTAKQKSDIIRDRGIEFYKSLEW